MSCQLFWNSNEYKTNPNDAKEVSVIVLTAPVRLSNINNNALDGLEGHLVIDIAKTPMDKIDEFQENYNIVFSNGSDVIGSLYVVTYYKQPKSDKLETSLANVQGTLSCKGIFSEFNNGTAIIEYDNNTGKRCLSLYEKSSVSSPVTPPKKVSFKIKTPSYNAPEVVEQTIRSDNSTNNPPIWALTQIRKITVTEDKYNLFTEAQKKEAKLLTSLTGNGVITNEVPPQQSGSYILVFDDFTSIAFSTGFNSDFGFGIYKYTGTVNNIENYTISKISWNSQASGATGTDEWEIILE